MLGVRLTWVRRVGASAIAALGVAGLVLAGPASSRNVGTGCKRLTAAYLLHKPNNPGLHNALILLTGESRDESRCHVGAAAGHHLANAKHHQDPDGYIGIWDVDRHTPGGHPVIRSLRDQLARDGRAHLFAAIAGRTVVRRAWFTITAYNQVTHPYRRRVAHPPHIPLPPRP